MGLEDDVEKGLSESRLKKGLKDAGSFCFEKTKDALPWLGVAAAGAVTYYIINNIEFVGTGHALTYRLPEYQRLFFSLCLSGGSAFLCRNAIDHVRHRHLFRNISKTGQELSLEEICEKEAEKEVDGNKHPETRAWKSFKYMLKHPKTAAALVTSRLFYEDLYGIYSFCSKYFPTRDHLLDIIASDKPFSAKLYSDMSELGKVRDASISFTQAMTGQLLVDVALFSLAVLVIRFIDGLSYDSDYLKTVAKGCYFTLKGDKEGILRCKKELAGRLPSRKAYFDLASSCTRMGYLDDALEAWSDGFRLGPATTKIERMFLEAGLLLPNPFINNYKKHSRQIRKNPDEIQNYIDLSMLHLFLNNIDESLGVQEQIKERFPENAETRALYALVLEGIGMKEEARQKWGETIGLLLQGDTAQFQRVGESANEVLEYTPSRFFKNSLIFKRGKKEDLEQEKRWTLLLKENLSGETRYRTATPINVFEYGGYIYIMKREDGVRLSHITEDRVFYFSRAAEFLALIHTIMPKDDVKPINYLKSIESRLDQCNALDKGTREDILSSCTDIFNDYDSLTRVFMKDYHGDNVLIGYPYGKQKENSIVLALDFEDMGCGHPSLDTAKLLEQGRFFDNTAEGDKQRNSVLARYIQSFNDSQSNRVYKIESEEEFMLNHIRSTILKAISFYCFSYDQPKQESVRASFVDNMIHAIDRIRDGFSVHYRQFSRQYETLKIIAENLPLCTDQTRILS